MNNEKAIVLLKSLMDGVDPVTGEVLPEDHVCCTPPVMRALHEAILALHGEETAGESKPVLPEKPVAPAPEASPFMTKKGCLNAGRPWTQEDIDALKQMYQAGIAMDEICHVLQRRERGATKMLAYMGLLPVAEGSACAKPGRDRVGTTWLPEDDRLLCKMYAQKKSVEEMAEALHRSPYGVYCHMEKLDLYGEEEGYPRSDSLPQMTKQDQDALRDMARQGKSIAEMSAALGRPEASVAARLFYMGLSKEAPVHLPGTQPSD